MKFEGKRITLLAVLIRLEIYRVYISIPGLGSHYLLVLSYLKLDD